MPTIAGYTTTEKIYENSNTVVYRALQKSTRQAVVIKLVKGDRPDTDRLNRLRHEYLLLASFDSDYIIKTLGLEKHQNTLAMVLEDLQGEFLTLEEALQSTIFDTIEVLQIGIELTRALEEVHSRKIIYKDLNPSNILVSNDKKRIKLIDFNIATSSDADDNNELQSSLLDGTLPYISPEQTGRLKVAVDYRTDFYSLGVTLFQLATGSLPFETTEPAELVHAHLAQTPPSASKLNADIPGPLSAIISKLLEKSPSNRYQHSYGVIADLKRCLHSLREHGTIGNFEPGGEETLRTLNIPNRLYDRDNHVEVLSSGLNLLKDGESVIYLISGPSGVGKSSLVQKFKKCLSREKNYFLQSSFEPVSSITPYAAFSVTIQHLVRQILSEGKESIDLWKRNFLKALDGEGKVLTELIPELDLILGKQESISELNPVETERRFTRVFQSFFQAACHAGPPLILFFDDLHWADPDSLKLLDTLLGSADLGGFMFIATYRDELDDGKNQLSRFIYARENSHLHQTKRLPVGELNLQNTSLLLEQTLNLETQDIASLATICHKKTGGNPFYLKQFLYSINRESHLRYSSRHNRWEWDEEKVYNSHLTKNIADLLVKRIEDLSESTRNLLKIASCIGHTFSIQLLTKLLGYSPEECLKELHDALCQGFILKKAIPSIADESYFHFAHDQIWQAIHQQISNDNCRIVRYKAGRILLNTVAKTHYDRQLFEIASHLNCGIDLITDESEKIQLAKVNLDAAKKAKRSSDYTSAHSYILQGLSCLPDNSWHTDDRLAVTLHIEGCETAFLCSDYDDVELYFRAVTKYSTDVEDIARVYRTRVRSLKAQSLPAQAVDCCREILFRLGVKIPEQPSRLQMLLSLMRSRLRLFGVSQSQLRNLPQMTDRKALLTIGFLHDMGTAAYTANPHLLPLLSEHALRLTLRYGNSVESSVTGYLTHGLLLCASSARNIPSANLFASTALQLRTDMADEKTGGLPTYIYNSFIAHWQSHIRTTLQPLKIAIQEGLKNGDLDTSANAACSLSFRHYFQGSNLSTTRSEIEQHFTLIDRLNQQLQLNRIKVIRQAVNNLTEETREPAILKGQYFDEDVQLSGYLQSGDKSSYCLAMIIKLSHAVLFNNYRQALDYSDKAKGYLPSLISSVFLPVFHFYDSLARLAEYGNFNASEKIASSFIIRKNQNLLKIWARYAPQNYGHKFSLVEAERERIRGNSEKAMEWYDKAIHLAKEHEYLQEEALAYECAARFYNGKGKAHIARPYMREARYCYQRWGAVSKVNHLDAQEWVIPSSHTHTSLASSGTIPMSNTLLPGEGGSRLDMMTVIKASRILNSEMVLDELLKKMMRIMLESAGAQRGFLIFRDKHDWKIKVRGSIYRSSIVTLTDTPISSQDIASVAIVNYVTHAAVDVVLNDACKEGLFTNDSYILQKKPRSLLCMPIIHQGEIFCILYLENNLATGAFPPDRQELLHLLGTQAAISLKNSRLFEELERTVTRMNTEVEKRRNTQLQLLHAEKLSALGRLSASIAHEFGNPLMGLKYLIDDFHKRDGISGSDKQLLELGLEECERMKKLIQNLQRLNKPSTGRLTRIDIHNLIDNVLLFQKKHFSANRIRLKKDYDHSLPQVDAIVDQITQVLFNLTMNSVDAMIDGGGLLTVKTRKSGAGMVIEVSDTGTGIAYDNQDRMFEPFFSTKTEEDGTGLGLFISYGIIKHHKGNLDFISTPGSGTTFIISLPTITENPLKNDLEVEKITAATDI